MADNTIVNPGAGGDRIATDELVTLNGSAVPEPVKVQRVKAGFGADGDHRDVSSSQPLPVDSTPLLASVVDGSPGFERAVVGTVQQPVSANFFGPSMPQDGFTVAATGSGHTVSLAGSSGGARYLKIASGVTADTQTVVQADDLVTMPCHVNTQISASQRIAGCMLFVELAGVNAAGMVVEDATGPLDWVALRFDGTNANNAVLLTRSGGGSVSASGSVSLGTTVATGTLPDVFPTVNFDLLCQPDRITSVGTTTNGTSTPQGQVARNIALPSPKLRYRYRVRVVNGPVPPASSTDWRLHQVRIMDHAALAVQVIGGIGRFSDSQGSVPVIGQVTVTAGQSRFGFVAAHGIWINDTNAALAASGTFTGAIRDCFAVNTGAAYSSPSTMAEEIRLEVMTDVAGTLYLEVSNDAATWRRVKSAATAQAAGAGTVHYAQLIHAPTTRFARAVYVNGAAAQTFFSLNTVQMAA